MRVLLLCALLALVSSHVHAGRFSQQLLASRYEAEPAVHAADDSALEAKAAAAEEPQWLGAEKVSSLTSDVKSIFSIEDIKTILPHRYPFLLVDKVIEFIPGKKAVGIKNIAMNEPQFTGHFPERAIMPGVLQVEAMAQLGGIVCLQQPISDGKGTFFFAGVDGVKWKRPVVPGDTLVMEMELLSWKAKFGIAKMRGKAYVDGKVAIEVNEFTFALK